MDNRICRAKSLDTGEWVYGYYVSKTDPLLGCAHPYILCQEYNSDTGLLDSFIFWCRVDSDTVCRYTGKKDKNGVDIFENDIIDASDEEWYAAGPAGHDSPIILVEWSDYYCGFDPFSNYDCDCGVYIDANGCKVIGNIFDNPKLIEG